MWADGLWMPDGGFGDELVALLAEEPVGLSCDELARRTGRRRTDVLDTLRWDPRVWHDGRGRGSRWRVTTTLPLRALRDGLGRTDTGDPDSSPVPAGEHGKRLEPIPGQTTVYEMLGEAPAA
jgi:hypothetical protein